MPDQGHAESERPKNGADPQNLQEFVAAGHLKFRWPQDVEAAALARARYEVEPGLKAVHRLEGPDPNDLRIKLLEVKVTPVRDTGVALDSRNPPSTR